MRVLYEDENLLVFDKPSGMPSVPHSADETGTAVGEALALYPQLRGIGDKPLEPGIAHRLDTGTSGVLVFAKTNAELARLKTIWKLPPPKGVRKVYRAISFAQNPEEAARFLGALGQGPIEIHTSLGHSDKSSKRMLAKDPVKKRGVRGKWLVAHTRILSARRVGEFYDLEVEIRTGVMHQIRCHLANLGLPIIGDPIYGTAESRKSAPRLMLHAWRIELPLEVEAPLPSEWADFRR